MAYRVELTKNAEAELEELYLWVVERAPSQGVYRAFFTVDESAEIVRVVHIRRGARQRPAPSELKGD